MPTPELKSCPFCGENPFAQSSFTDADMKSACYITCRKCDVSPDGCYRKASEWNEAVAIWNTRAIEATRPTDMEVRDAE